MSNDVHGDKFINTYAVPIKSHSMISLFFDASRYNSAVMLWSPTPVFKSRIPKLVFASSTC